MSEGGGLERRTAARPTHSPILWHEAGWLPNPWDLESCDEGPADTPPLSISLGGPVNLTTPAKVCLVSPGKKTWTSAAPCLTRGAQMGLVSSVPRGDM